MLINLSELFSCEGKEKLYTVELEMVRFHAPDGDYEIVQREPVLLRGRNIGNRTLEIEGKVNLSLDIPCGRCLEPVRNQFQLEIHRALDMKQSDEERIENLDEQPYLNGYNLDVDQLVCNELLLSLPMKVLCNEDCKGICNRCGTNLNHETCDCDTRSPSLGMSVVQDIFKQFKEV